MTTDEANLMTKAWRACSCECHWRTPVGHAPSCCPYPNRLHAEKDPSADRVQKPACPCRGCQAEYEKRLRLSQVTKL